MSQTARRSTGIPPRSTASNDGERELMRQMRAVEEIAHAHREQQAAGPVIPSEPLLPTHWGKLEVIEKIGRGAFGEVYRARETALDREVALKLIREEHADPPAHVDTILEEGRLMARVDHENVARVYGAERHAGHILESGWSSSTDRPSNRSSPLKAGWARKKQRESAGISAAPWRPSIVSASSTVTSSPPMSCARRAAASSSWISEQGARCVVRAPPARTAMPKVRAPILMGTTRAVHRRWLEHRSTWLRRPCCGARSPPGATSTVSVFCSIVW